MASYLGKIGEYDSATEEWPSYRERLEHFFKANKVADEQKDAFLTCIGKDTFGLLRALIAPAKLVDKTYDELTTALSSHLAPKPLVITERFRFHKREQKEVRVSRRMQRVCRSWQSLEEHSQKP